mgnify:CR=1 FL=1
MRTSTAVKALVSEMSAEGQQKHLKALLRTRRKAVHYGINGDLYVVKRSMAIALVREVIGG